MAPYLITSEMPRVRREEEGRNEKKRLA